MAINANGGLSLMDSFGRSGRLGDPRPNDPNVGGGGTTPTEDDIVKAVMETYRHEYQTRKPFEREWNRAWMRVQNRYDFSRKSRWQSQKNFPAVLLLALQYVWELTKSLQKAGDKWFEAETSDADWQPLLDVPRDLVRQYLQDFLPVWYEAIFYGVITGPLYLRVIAEDDGFPDLTDEESTATKTDVFAAAGLSTSVPSFGFGTPSSVDGKVGPPSPPGKKGFQIRVEAINPRCVVRDTSPRRKMRYLIHTQSLSRAEFRAEGNARGWKYIEEICKMSTQFQGEYEASERKRLEKKLAASPDARGDQVVLHHCYGEFLDSNGEWVVDEPSFFIVGNRKYIVSDVVLLPYWHGEIPVCCGGTLILPGNPYSSSLLSVNLDAQETKVDLNNQILDYMNVSINPPTEVDVDQINNVRPNQLAGGIFPGKLLEVQKYGGVTGPAVARSGMPDMSSGVWQSLALLKGELQEYTGISGVSGMPKTRNRISQDEEKRRSVASTGIIEQISHNLEATLEDVVFQAFLLILQKLPQDEWEAFINKKIEGLKNRTATTPPGAGPSTPPPPVVMAPQGGTPPGQPPPGAPGLPGTPPPEGATPPMATPPPPPEYENPLLVERYKALAKLGPKDRFEQLAGLYRFKVKIYTALESRRDKFEKVMQFIEMSQGTPQLAARLKWHVVAEESAECLELDPEHWLWPNSGETLDRPLVPDPQHLTAVRPPDLTPTQVTQQPLTPPRTGF